MKKKLFIWGLLAFSWISLGCATMPLAVETAEGNNLVGDVLSAYRNYERHDFAELLGENYYPRNLDNQIEANSCKEKDVVYSFSVGEIIQAKKELDIAFEWSKTRYSLVSVRRERLTGSAHFIFENEDGKWKLVRIRGNNPLVN